MIQERTAGGRIWGELYQREKAGPERKRGSKGRGLEQPAWCGEAKRNQPGPGSMGGCGEDPLKPPAWQGKFRSP